MWELIASNKRKSVILFILMGFILMFLGMALGVLFTESEDGFFIGIIIATLIWIILAVISYYAGGSILLMMSNATHVTRDVHPQLFNIVEEMKLASQLPAMPEIYIINEESPNAFATGRSPEKSAIAVTAGLLARLNRDELQGVIAHEMAHIYNRDTLFLTFAGVMLGAIVLISEVFLRGFFYSRSGGRYKSSSGGGQLQIVILALAIILAIIAPILARILYFSISRKREYLADATAVKFTRYPEGLASALEKIANSQLPMQSVNKVTAPMYIVMPLNMKGKAFSRLFSTHPPIEQRIKVLRSIAGGAGYVNYQKAFQTVLGNNIIPNSGLKLTETVPLKAVTPEPTSTTAIPAAASLREQKRAFGNIVMAVENYKIIQCDCGLKIKIPNKFKSNEIQCPKCGSLINV